MPSLKRDPSRTTILRRRFVADMTRRFKKLSKEVWALVVTDDVFGLEIAVPLKLNRQDDGMLANRQEWRFRNDGEKIQEFQKWLSKEVDLGILTTDGLGDSWTNDYVGPSYRKGYDRGFTEANRMIDYTGTKDQFLNDAFNQPETISKVQSIYTRTFSELKGVSATMDQQMSRILADGLSTGEGPAVLARKLQKNISKITKTRAWVLARTEVIRAHAEGQLDSFGRLGIEEVDAMVEWSTAGDDRVCAECAGLNGTTYTIKEAHGIIPIHPNCRCAWIPVSPKAMAKRIKPEVEDTKFKTAEEYRQKIVSSDFDILSTKNLVAQLEFDESNARLIWHKSSSADDIIKNRDSYIKLHKELRSKENDLNTLLLNKRNILRESVNKKGSITIIESSMKSFQDETDEILSWIPKNRKTKLGFENIGMRKDKNLSSLGMYEPDLQYITLRTDSKSTFVHELGHHITHQTDGFLESQNAFGKSRTIGEKIGIIPEYQVEGFIDKFGEINSYAGRATIDGEFKEITSVGFENLWTDPVNFALKDPDWFNMVVSQLKGIPIK